jgi:transcriptional regulator with XRE-family HTH domain
MPIADQVKEGFWTGSSPARRRFATSFNSVIDSLPVQKQLAKASSAGLPPSTLSCYRRARRVPSAQTLAEIYEAVQRAVPSGCLPITLAELECLRVAAAARHQATCQRNDVPISSDASLRREDGKAARSSGWQRTGTPSAQDRRNIDKAVKLTLDALASHAAAGRRRDMLSLAWSAATTMSPAQVAEAISELDAQGQQEIAEAVLLSGRKRTEAHAMRLALALMAIGLPSYAEAAMRAALPTTEPV